MVSLVIVVADEGVDFKGAEKRKMVA